METNNDIQQLIKRPTGMTILLVLSLINACFQIFSAGVMYIGLPVMNEMINTGQMEPMIQSFRAFMNEEMMEAYMNELSFRASINPNYYLFNFILYIVSLAGVLKMFKLHRIGFHAYSISQILLLIVSVIFIYSDQAHGGFFSEFLMTLMFILLYHLYFRRIEIDTFLRGGGDVNANHPNDL